MLRDKSLISLSHQHQHALALCVRIDRGVKAGETDPAPWQAEIDALYRQEIAVHFAAEESVLFPAAARFGEMEPLVNELISEHAALRDLLERAAKLDAASIRQLGALLSQHIRKEERQLFETMQRLMRERDLCEIGIALDKVLAEASDACILPSQATRLKAKD